MRRWIGPDARSTTLYRHFPGKEDLVLAYLGEVDRAMRAQVDDAVTRGLPAADTIRALGESIAQGINTPAVVRDLAG
jgi:AcrR family transcriptional regulator